MIAERRWIVTLLLLAAGVGCVKAPASPEELAALRAFQLAGADPDEPRLQEWFDLGQDDARKTALLDALDALGAVTAAEVTSIEALAGTRGALVDIRVSLPAGGSARYSVQVEPDGQGGWRIGWLAGPGVEWPTPRRRRDGGLTTSVPDGP